MVELGSFERNHLACKGLKYVSSSPVQKKFTNTNSLWNTGQWHFLEQDCHFEGIIKIRNLFFVKMLSKGKKNYKPII